QCRDDFIADAEDDPRHAVGFAFDDLGVAFLARRERNEFPHLYDLVISVEEPDGGGDEVGGAALELHPVTVAVVVNAEAERSLREKPRRRKGRSCCGEIARSERANGGDDLLGGRVDGGVIAEDLRYVRARDRRASAIGDRDHALEL